MLGPRATISARNKAIPLRGIKLPNTSVAKALVSTSNALISSQLSTAIGACNSAVNLKTRSFSSLPANLPVAHKKQSSHSSSSSSSSPKWRQWLGALSVGALAAGQMAYAAEEKEKKGGSDYAGEHVEEELQHMFTRILDNCSVEPGNCSKDILNSLTFAHEIAGNSEHYASYLLLCGSVLASQYDKADSSSHKDVDTVFTLFKQAGELFNKLFPENDPRSTIATFFKANFLMELGRREEAMKAYTDVRESFVKIHGTDHEAVVEIDNIIASLVNEGHTKLKKKN